MVDSNVEQRENESSMKQWPTMVGEFRKQKVVCAGSPPHEEEHREDETDRRDAAVGRIRSPYGIEKQDQDWILRSATIVRNRKIGWWVLVQVWQCSPPREHSMGPTTLERAWRAARGQHTLSWTVAIPRRRRLTWYRMWPHTNRENLVLVKFHPNESDDPRNVLRVCTERVPIVSIAFR